MRGKGKSLYTENFSSVRARVYFRRSAILPSVSRRAIDGNGSGAEILRPRSERRYRDTVGSLVTEKGRSGEERREKCALLVTTLGDYSAATTTASTAVYHKFPGRIFSQTGRDRPEDTARVHKNSRVRRRVDPRLNRVLRTGSFKSVVSPLFTARDRGILHLSPRR